MKTYRSLVNYVECVSCFSLADYEVLAMIIFLTKKTINRLKFNQRLGKEGEVSLHWFKVPLVFKNLWYGILERREERAVTSVILQYLWCTFLQSTSSLIILPITSHFSSFYSLIGIIMRKRCRPVVRAQQRYYWNSKIIDTNTKPKYYPKWL